ncbi:hypothetical protein GCM10009733_094200 [Nonomuraea maheshkhaliensis]|uniref:Uncharacterized protein n=1 Tax=Nonomuraea maheshkhaliensis TaxID=419590 RepID=A0ABN2H6M5_9ACTN
MGAAHDTEPCAPQHLGRPRDRVPIRQRIGVPGQERRCGTSAVFAYAASSRSWGTAPAGVPRSTAVSPVRTPRGVGQEVRASSSSSHPPPAREPLPGSPAGTTACGHHAAVEAAVEEAVASRAAAPAAPRSEPTSPPSDIRGSTRLVVSDVVSEGAQRLIPVPAPFTGWDSAFSAAADFGALILVDPATMTRYHPLKMYTEFVENWVPALDHGMTGRGYVSYPAPADNVSSVTLEAENLGQVSNLPIT